MDYYEYTESFMSSMGRVDNACLGCKAEYPTMDRATVPADPMVNCQILADLGRFCVEEYGQEPESRQSKKIRFLQFIKPSHNTYSYVISTIMTRFIPIYVGF